MKLTTLLNEAATNFQKSQISKLTKEFEGWKNGSKKAYWVKLSRIMNDIDRRKWGNFYSDCFSVQFAEHEVELARNSFMAKDEFYAAELGKLDPAFNGYLITSGKSKYYDNWYCIYFDDSVTPGRKVYPTKDLIKRVEGEIAKIKRYRIPDTLRSYMDSANALLYSLRKLEKEESDIANKWFNDVKIFLKDL